MIGMTKEALEAERPSIPADLALDFCLNRIYLDKEHMLTDEVCDCLTFEELIGALLLARDRLAP